MKVNEGERLWRVRGGNDNEAADEQVQPKGPCLFTNQTEEEAGGLLEGRCDSLLAVAKSVYGLLAFGGAGPWWKGAVGGKLGVEA